MADLPDYVHAYRDRHGRMRHYFRRRGVRRIPISAEPGSDSFAQQYQAALEEAARIRGPAHRPAPPKRPARKAAGDEPNARVYFIRSGPRIKIGTTNNIRRRMKRLQTGSPYGLCLLLVIKGGERLEREFHERFAAYRLHGEWFEPGPALRDFILSERTKRRQTLANLDRLG